MSALTGFIVGSIATAAYGYYSGTQSDEESTNRGLGGIASRSTGSSSASVGASPQMGLLTDVIGQVWSYIAIAAANDIKASVEPTFKETLPGPLASLHFTKIDLGTVPIRFDNVFVHPVDKANNTLQFDMDVIWDGDCDIRLKANILGTFGVKSMKLKGRMSFLLKPLVPTLSVVNAITYSFINPPHIDLDFVGVANIADIDMLKRRIHAIILDTIKGMLVLPKRMLTKLEPSTKFSDIYHPPLGICRVTVVQGESFAIEKRALRADDIPDAYCIVSLGDSTRQTKTIQDSTTPVWNEALDFVLCDHDQIVSMEIFDQDTGSFDSDDYLGMVETTIGEILLAGGTKTLAVQQDYKPTGASVTIACELVNFTSDLATLSKAAPADSPSVVNGFVTVLIEGADNLPLKKEDAASFIKVQCGEVEHVTPTIAFAPGVDALNPLYDSAIHIPLDASLLEAGKMKPLVLSLMNGEECLGTTKITHEELAKAPGGKLVEKTRKIGSKGATVEFNITLAGLKVRPPSEAVTSTTNKASLKGSVTGSTKSSAQKVEVTIQKGQGFKAQKTRRFKKADIPDVYCNVKFGSSPTVWRTPTIKNSLAPVWDAKETYPLINHNQIINLDVYDEDSGARDGDDHLGTLRVTAGQVILAGGSMDIEVHLDGNPTGIYITVCCKVVDA